jgi:glycosyltransferase involved in cell wall biosynthesis
VKQGHRVTVVGWGKRTEFDDEGVKVVFQGGIPVPRIGWLFNRINMQRLVNRLVGNDGLEILESPDWCGLSAGIKPRCPVVIRCHGSDTYFGKLLNYEPRWSVRLAEKIALQGANGIASVSKYTADVTRSVFNLKSPIEVIPNGIDPKQYPVEEEVEENTILYFGTLVRKKGVLDLAKIFSLVVDRNPYAKLQLVGRDSIDKITGVSTWELMKKEMNAKALARTVYAGFQSHSHIQQWIKQAAVCVFPSYAEALPVSWLEAMACGKPIIASKIGWAPEIIQNGDDGMLVDPSDHTQYAKTILQVIQDRTLLKKMGEAARHKVEREFAIEMVAKKSIVWYQKFIGRS